MLANFLKKIFLLNNGYYSFSEKLIFWTAVITFFWTFVIITQEQLGSPIRCFIPESAQMQELPVIERECINSRLVINENFGDFLNGFRDRPQYKFTFYRWIVPSLIFQVLVFISPLLTFKCVIDKTSLTEEILNQTAVKMEEKKGHAEQFAEIFAAQCLYQKRNGQTLCFALKLFIVKLMVPFTAITSYIIFIIFLNTENYLWCFNILNKWYYHPDEPSQLFPFSVYCTFNRTVGMHRVQVTTECLLEMNVSIEKTTTILSIWYLLLLMLALLHCCYQIFFAYIPYCQKMFLRRHLRLSLLDVTEADLEKFIKDLTYDGIVQLNVLTQRFDNMFITHVVAETYDNFMLHVWPNVGQVTIFSNECGANVDFLRFITIIPEAIVIINLPNPKFILFALLGIEGICLIFLNILFCFVDKFPGSYEKLSDKKYFNQEQSSLADAVYLQASELFLKSHKKPLTYEDFWSLNPENRPENLLTNYRKLFKTIKNKKQNWLLLILLKSNWISVFASMVFGFLSSLFVIADPLFLKLVILSNERSYPFWCGILVAVGSFITNAIRLIFDTKCEFYRINLFIDVYSTITNLIYEKCLKLSAFSKSKYSAGQLINMFSVDTFVIREFIFGLPQLSCAIMTVIMCLIGLYSIIEKNVFYGIATISFFLPLNFFIFKVFNKIQKTQMQIKDSRLKMITDILSGIKILKLYAWEEPMEKMVMSNRTNEIEFQKRMHYCSTMTTIAFNAYPIVATIVCLIGYVVIDGHQLTPEIAFLTLLLFNLMRASMYAIPSLIQRSIKAKISFDRIQNFLLEDEVPTMKNTMEPSSKDTVLELYNSTFSWSPDISDDTVPVLKSLNFEIAEGELIGIIGRVGAGKSSLLSAICGELYQSSGTFYRKPEITVAYVPQEAWIQNLSLRDNILFGKAYDEKAYQKTIEVCALKDDLRQFAAGDETEIGERGLNLSGGQKARVALARAVYQSSDLYILDDTLSAVDSHVGAHIFQNVISNDSGILKGKTRLFALNSISFLSKCDKIVVLKEGNIVDFGTFNDLSSRKNETFIELVKELAHKAEHESDDIDAIETPASVQEQIKSRNSTSDDSKDALLNGKDLNKGKLIKAESTSTKKVALKIYFSYLKAFGIKLAFAYFFTLFIVRTFFESYSQLWMAKWSSNLVNGTKDNTENLKIYGYLSFSSCVIIGTAFLLIAFGAANASKRLYENLFLSLLRSPMAFFDSTPMGRILARISSDIEQIDFVIPQAIRFLAKLIADCVFYSSLAVYILPQLVIFILPGVYLIATVLKYFTTTCVAIRRLASACSSKVTSHIQESYVGVTTLRIFGAQKKFCQKMINYTTKVAEAKFAEKVASRWSQLIMELLISVFSSIFVISAIYFGHIGILSVSSVALVASTGTMLKGFFGDIIHQIIAIESNAVSVERVQEYIENEHEAEWTSKNPPDSNWPSNGTIKFKDFSLKYRPSTPLVLKRLNLHIQGGQKVGIVGRTGAGKTSLTMALFRMIEPADGTIFIDGIDFRQLGLHELRKSLTIIPQDPVLFCGKLRVNLDPFEQFSDVELWDAIEKAHLRHFVDAFPEKLNHEISEGGGNLSVGQRQLVCLARAILRKKTKILILDEATAAVDIETDHLIQQSIRTLFSKCTILTIAHRLNTIMDYDKVLVMDFGEIKEFDSPQALLSNKNSLFYSLASQAKIV